MTINKLIFPIIAVSFTACFTLSAVFFGMMGQNGWKKYIPMTMGCLFLWAIGMAIIVFAATVINKANDLNERIDDFFNQVNQIEEMPSRGQPSAIINRLLKAAEKFVKDDEKISLVINDTTEMNHGRTRVTNRKH